ncbi:MAG: hypothetical protein DWI22_06945 [Planctomycetota bacterium]|nr:MAG: hypothetical protein DWI22_06945 [Planctomycetota bacterium]
MCKQSPGQGPANVTEAGGLSPYGIIGLGGNAFEWEETSFALNDSSCSSVRGIRGGGWFVNSFILSSSTRSDDDPAGESDSIGFRVASLSSSASVPEPSLHCAPRLSAVVARAGRNFATP